jgi:hypothetical protein
VPLQLAYRVHFQYLDYTALNGRITDEEYIFKEAVMAYLRYYHGICLEGLVKTKETVRTANVLNKIPKTEHFSNICLQDQFRTNPPCDTV